MLAVGARGSGRLGLGSASRVVTRRADPRGARPPPTVLLGSLQALGCAAQVFWEKCLRELARPALGLAAAPGGVGRRVLELRRGDAAEPVEALAGAGVADLQLRRPLADLEALTGDQSHVAEMHAAFEKRGAHMARRLNELKGVRCIEPSGAFYCFPDVRESFASLGVANAAGFCEVMLEKAHVALVAGDAFGMDTHIRMSFATGMDQIDTGIDRMAEVLGRK